MYCIPYGIQYKIAPWAQFGEFLVEFYLLLRLLAFDKMCLVAFWGLDLWLLPLEGKICVWLHGWFHFACFSNAVCGERLVKFLVAIVVAFLAGGGALGCICGCILLAFLAGVFWWAPGCIFGCICGCFPWWGALGCMLGCFCGCFLCWGAPGCICGPFVVAFLAGERLVAFSVAFCLLLWLLSLGGRLLALLVAFVVAFLAGGRFVAFFENCDCFP